MKIKSSWVSVVDGFWGYAWIWVCLNLGKFVKYPHMCSYFWYPGLFKITSNGNIQLNTILIACHVFCLINTLPLLHKIMHMKMMCSGCLIHTEGLRHGGHFIGANVSPMPTHQLAFVVLYSFTRRNFREIIWNIASIKVNKCMKFKGNISSIHYISVVPLYLRKRNLHGCFH
jgi:hypothetical protein